MSGVSWMRADVVECLGLKTCCSSAGGRNSLIEGKMALRGPWPLGIATRWVSVVPCDESLSGLGIGMSNEVFQFYGRRQDLRESL